MISEVANAVPSANSPLSVNIPPFLSFWQTQPAKIWSLWATMRVVQISQLWGRKQALRKAEENVLLFQLCVRSPKVTKPIREDSRKSFEKQVLGNSMPAVYLIGNSRESEWLLVQAWFCFPVFSDFPAYSKPAMSKVYVAQHQTRYTISNYQPAVNQQNCLVKFASC